MSRHADTIVALATPVGTSALAVIRVSGPDTTGLLSALWGAAPPPRELQRGDYRDVAGRIVDDVLYVFFRGPRSYTGEDSLEISCHGNPFIAQRIVEDLMARGARGPEPGEFTLRAFLNGRMDLSQAEAVMDLIQARGDRAIEAANRQLRGGLSGRMTKLIGWLTEVLAEIEAYIDFPEEDLPAEDRERLIANIDRIIGDTNELSATARYGELLRNGVRTVIVGAPNVGKSSLLNKLIGHERALVSAEPGTTRDYIEETLAMGPHCLRLIDTAGLNTTPGVIERHGIAKTWEQVAEADLVLKVSDVTQLETLAEQEELPVNVPVIRIVNKIDLLPSPSESLPRGVLGVSALNGDGLELLRRTVVQIIDQMLGAGTDEDMIAINARHEIGLKAALNSLNTARTALLEGVSYELVASELRHSLQAYETISGKVDDEQVLDALFARFCIGK